MATANVKTIDGKPCQLEVRKIGPCDAGQIRFGNQSGEVMRFEPNGDIFIRGRLAANDKEIVDALRDWLLTARTR